MRIKVGVMGAAGGKMTKFAKEQSYLLGRAIAEAGCVLMTGGCPGLPLEAARGAKYAGGLTVGISPGLNLHEHSVLYKSPTEYMDMLIFTGAGLMGREVIGVRSCDVVMIAGGRSGTLGEFSIAYDEGKPIGVLEGTGGITLGLRQIQKLIHKKTGSEVIYDKDPYLLLKKVLSAYERQKNRKFKYASD